jgi:hypothetical protein
MKHLMSHSVSVVRANAPPLLSEEKIIRQLRALRHSPDNRASVRGGRKIPLRHVAEMAGLHRATLYRAIMESRISDKSREALSPVLLFMSQTGV